MAAVMGGEIVYKLKITAEHSHTKVTLLITLQLTTAIKAQ
jgi:hypothetical protein